MLKIDVGPLELETKEFSQFCQVSGCPGEVEAVLELLSREQFLSELLSACEEDPQDWKNAVVVQDKAISGEEVNEALGIRVLAHGCGSFRPDALAVLQEGERKVLAYFEFMSQSNSGAWDDGHHQQFRQKLSVLEENCLPKGWEVLGVPISWAPYGADYLRMFLGMKLARMGGNSRVVPLACTWHIQGQDWKWKIEAPDFGELAESGFTAPRRTGGVNREPKAVYSELANALESQKFRDVRVHHRALMVGPQLTDRNVYSTFHLVHKSFGSSKASDYWDLSWGRPPQELLAVQPCNEIFRDKKFYWNGNKCGVPLPARWLGLTAGDPIAIEDFRSQLQATCGFAIYSHTGRAHKHGGHYAPNFYVGADESPTEVGRKVSIMIRAMLSLFGLPIDPWFYSNTEC